MATSNVTVTPGEAKQIADRCQDAYSFDRYGEKNWRDVAQLLARRGFDAREIEAILRSKWTRWADTARADAFATVAGMRRQLRGGDLRPGGGYVAELVAGTDFAEVDPPTGWEHISTGGGCTAWSKAYGAYTVNVVAAEDVTAPTLEQGQPVSCEIYDAEHNAVLSFSADSFVELVAQLARIHHINCDGFGGNQ